MIAHQARGSSISKSPRRVRLLASHPPNVQVGAMILAFIATGALSSGRFLCFSTSEINTVVDNDRAFCDASGGSQCLSVYISTKNASKHLKTPMKDNTCDAGSCFTGHSELKLTNCFKYVLSTDDTPTTDMIKFESMKSSTFPKESDLDYSIDPNGASHAPTTLSCLLSTDINHAVLGQRDVTGYPRWVIASGLPFTSFESADLPALGFYPSSSETSLLRYGRITEGAQSAATIPSGSGAIYFTSTDYANMHTYVLPGALGINPVSYFFKPAAVKHYSSIKSIGYLSPCAQYVGLTIAEFLISPGVSAADRTLPFDSGYFFDFRCNTTRTCQDASELLTPCTSCDLLTQTEVSVCTPYSDTTCAPLPTILPSGDHTDPPVFPRRGRLSVQL